MRTYYLYAWPYLARIGLAEYGVGSHHEEAGEGRPGGSGGSGGCAAAVGIAVVGFAALAWPRLRLRLRFG